MPTTIDLALKQVLAYSIIRDPLPILAWNEGESLPSTIMIRIEQVLFQGQKDKDAFLRSF